MPMDWKHQDHSPAARDMNPLLAGVAAKQRGKSKCKGNGESGVAEIEHGWMNHHLGVLEKRIQAVAV